MSVVKIEEISDLKSPFLSVSLPLFFSITYWIKGLNPF